MYQEIEESITSPSGTPRLRQSEEDKKQGLLRQLSRSPVNSDEERRLKEKSERKLKERPKDYLNRDPRLLWKLARRKYSVCLGYVLPHLPREEARQLRRELDLDIAIFERHTETHQKKPLNVYECLISTPTSTHCTSYHPILTAD